MNRLIARIPISLSKKINKTVVSSSEADKVLPSESYSKPTNVPKKDDNLYFPPHPDYQGSNIFSIPVKNIENPT